MAKKAKKSSAAGKKTTTVKKTTSSKKTTSNKGKPRILEKEEEENIEEENIEEEALKKATKLKKTTEQKKSTSKSKIPPKKTSKSKKKESEESEEEQEALADESNEKAADKKGKTQIKQGPNKKALEMQAEKRKIAEEKKKIEEEILSFHDLDSDSKKSSGKKKRNYSEVDKLIIEYIKKHRRRLYDLFLTDLQISEAELSKSLKRLEAKEKIIIKSEMEDVKYKKYIYYNEIPVKLKPGEGNYIAFNEFNNLPCMLCPDLKKCNLEQDTYNPINCDYLNGWIETDYKGEKFENPFKYRYEDLKKKSDKDDTASEEEEGKEEIEIDEE